MNEFNTKDTLEDTFDFDFKPIHEGMGFHKEKKSGASHFNKKNTSQSFKPSVEISQKGLESIYGEDDFRSQSASMSEKKNEYKVEFLYNKPRAYQQALAYIVDIFTVFAFVMLTLYSFSLTLNTFCELDLKVIFQSFPLLEKVGFLSAFFAIFYLVYFCLFDLFSSTLGKSFFNMKVMDTQKKKPTVSQVLLRALVSLTSTLAFFLPLFISFQDRISETIVRIQKKSKKKVPSSISDRGNLPLNNKVLQ